MVRFFRILPSDPSPALNEIGRPHTTLPFNYLPHKLPYKRPFALDSMASLLDFGPPSAIVPSVVIRWNHFGQLRLFHYSLRGLTFARFIEDIRFFEPKFNYDFSYSGWTFLEQLTNMDGLGGDCKVRDSRVGKS